MTSTLERILPKPGDLLVGRYDLLEEIGRGGFGVVYRAHQRGINEEVAIKLLLPHVLSRPDVAKRFAREVQVAKGLRHPNTIRILDYAQTDEGLPFYVMEFLRGHSLDDLLREKSYLAPARARHVCVQVLQSLAEAHANGIIHRDLKPGNIILCDIVGAKDLVKVLDFGIAKALGDNAGENITRGDMMLGTPTYMSPEQCAGRQDIDHRSDIYAVGLILAECVSGRTAVMGHTQLEIITKHASDEPLEFPIMVRRSPVWSVIERACAKNRDWRFGSAGEMAAALEALGELPGRGADQLAVHLSGQAAPLPQSTQQAQGWGPPPTNPGFHPSMAEHGVAAGRMPPTVVGPRAGFESTIAGPLDSGEVLWSQASAAHGAADALGTGAGLGKAIAIIAVVLLCVAAGAFFMLRGGGGATEESPEPGAPPAEHAEAAHPIDPSVEGEAQEVEEVPTLEEAQALLPHTPEQEAADQAASEQRAALGMASAVATERTRSAVPLVRPLRFEGLEGVRVSLGDTELGVTPFEVPAPVVAREIEVHLERNGYRPAEMTLSLLSENVEVTLRRVRRSSGGATHRTPTESSPFGSAPIDRSER